MVGRTTKKPAMKAGFPVSRKMPTEN